MADIRTMVLKLAADTDSFTKGLNKADNEVQGFGGKLGEFGKKAAAAFAVAGAAAAAYAGKLLIDGVKAAIEDAAAQEKLAATLENVTGATQAQIAATEDYITKTTLATGVADDELRPSLDRLVRATNDVAEAQKLQALALDVSAGTGKSLQAVTEALSKAQEGNLAGLTRLGVGLSKADLETMSLEEITAKLAKTFEGQASRQADTFQGKMARLTVAFNEGKETVGAFVLDAITPLVTKFVNDVIPAVQRFAEEMGPKLKPIIDGITTVITRFLVPAFKALWSYLTDFIIPILKSVLGPVVKALRDAFDSIVDKLGGPGGVMQTFRRLREILEPIIEFIRDKVAPVIGGALAVQFTILGKIIGGVIDVVKAVGSGVMTAANAILNSVEGMINGIINAWNRLPDWLRPGGPVKTVDLPEIKFNIGTSSETKQALADMERLAKAAEKPVEASVSVPMAASVSAASNVAAAAQEATKASTAASKKAAEKEAEKSKRLSKADADFINAVNAFVANWDQPPAPVVNVTGTMMDPEGVAREVARVLEASAGRTGAYSNLGLNPVGLRPVAV